MWSERTGLGRAPGRRWVRRGIRVITIRAFAGTSLERSSVLIRSEWLREPGVTRPCFGDRGNPLIGNPTAWVSGRRSRQQPDSSNRGGQSPGPCGYPAVVEAETAHSDFSKVRLQRCPRVSFQDREKRRETSTTRSASLGQERSVSPAGLPSPRRRRRSQWGFARALG